MPKQQFAEKSDESNIWKFEKQKKYVSFQDNNIWVADLASMQLISKYNKWFRFVLCVIGIFSKYAWFVPLQHKKRVLQLLMLFKKVLQTKQNIRW